MSKDTLTRAELAHAVYNELGLTRRESGKIVATLLEEISAALLKEELVKLSSFGTFSVRHKTERVGRNPKTGVEMPILPRRVVGFKASHVLKNKLNKMAGLVAD